MRWALGLLLLTSAGLKFADARLGPVAESVRFLSGNAQTSVVVIEAILGLWLLYGRAERLLWTCATVFFAGLGLVSLYLALTGVPSCGCFGERLAISPWYSFGLDALAIAFLWRWRPDWRGLDWAPAHLWRHEVRPAVLPLRMPIAVWSISLALIAVWGNWRYGSTALAFQRIQGYSAGTENSVFQIGEVEPARFTMSFPLHNLTNEPITIIGPMTSCRCEAVDPYPIRLGPLETRVVTFALYPSGGPHSLGA